jgi:hypothetical protein
VIVTVAGADHSNPSQTRYVNVRSPTKEPPDLNVKLPFAFRSSDPLPPPSTSSAETASPSASLSLARTPGAATVFEMPVVAV